MDRRPLPREELVLDRDFDFDLLPAPLRPLLPRRDLAIAAPVEMTMRLTIVLTDHASNMSSFSQIQKNRIIV